MWSHQGGFNLHICHPLIRNKHPRLLQSSIKRCRRWWFRTIQPPLVRTEHQGLNELQRCFVNANARLHKIYPLPYPGEVTSEHGVFEVGKPTHGCATHREKKLWGNHICGDTVSTGWSIQKKEVRMQVVDGKWSWNNTKFTVILILHRRTQILYTTTINVCQAENSNKQDSV